MQMSSALFILILRSLLRDPRNPLVKNYNVILEVCLVRTCDIYYLTFQLQRLSYGNFRGLR